MSTRAETLRLTLEEELNHDLAQSSAILRRSTAEWKPERFAAEQIRGLVRNVFLSQRHRANRQVVISAIDPDTRVSELCCDIGLALTEESGKNVCLAEMTQASREVEDSHGESSAEAVFHHGAGSLLRGCSHQISEGLWKLPAEAFWGKELEFAADALRRRLDQLRAEFDFSVIQAPAAGFDTTVALLGRLSDGVILVVEANATRRMAAQRVLANLRASDVTLLGTVLSERTFPIPERLYRRL